MTIRPLKCTLFGPVLALLLVGHAFGGEWKDPPRGQPVQIRSQVNYDANLTDPFFQSDERSYWEGSREVPDRGMWLGEKVPPLLKHTAKCFSTAKGAKHEVRFCEARLRGANMIDLYIHESNPAFDDSLIIQIRNGNFTCQFWTLYQAGPTKGLIWTTKRQKLTLDKKVYRKGVVIKGRIDIDVSDELLNPKYPDRPPRPITLYGVFKAIVK
jgi:hypothetical protein